MQPGQVPNSPSRPTGSSSRLGPRTQSISHQQLWWACFDGVVEQAKNILETYDLDVNKTNSKGQTCLWIACFQGHMPVVEFLLSLTDVRPVTESLFKLVSGVVLCCNVDKPCTELGKTPLYAACEMNRIDVVRYLLEETGASINMPTKFEESPLHIASFHGHDEIVQLLLASGAAINQCDTKKRTALNIASYLGNMSVVKILLQHDGVNTRLKDCFGQDPRDSAEDGGREEIVQILSKHRFENPTDEELELRLAEERISEKRAQIHAREERQDKREAIAKEKEKRERLEQRKAASVKKAERDASAERKRKQVAKAKREVQAEREKQMQVLVTAKQDINNKNSKEKPMKETDEQKVKDQAKEERLQHNSEKSKEILIVEKDVSVSSQPSSSTSTIEEQFKDVFSPKVLNAYLSLFAEYDIDNSGDIDSSELKALLEAAGKKVSLLEIGKLIEEVDNVDNGGNGDGMIDEFEFLRMLKDNQGPNVFAQVTKARASEASERRRNMAALKKQQTVTKLEMDKEKALRKKKQLEDEAERLRLANEQKAKQKVEWEERERKKLATQKEELDKEWAKPRFTQGGVVAYDGEESKND